MLGRIRDFLSGRAARLLIFAAGAVFSAAAASAAGKPNVLFLFADDQRDDTIAAYGNSSIKTPVLDGLVKRGFSFKRAYCMGSIHGAVCQPSRAMLMSGRSLYHVTMDLKGIPLMPEAFRANGYATFGTGKWHNGEASFKRGFEYGKNVFFGGMSNHEKMPLKDLKPDGTYTPKRTAEGFSSVLFADAAIDFLTRLPDERPFFTYVAFTAPHDPRQPPAEFVDPYYQAKPPLPENFMPQHPFFNGWMTGRDEALAGWPRRPEIVREQLAEYYGMITHLDGQVGRILQALQESGRANDTYIVYTADHGLAVGSHGLLGKQNLYEHSMGTPLIVGGPGVPAGKSSEALVYLYDLFPTLAGVAGIDLPPGVEGKDLSPIWKGEQTKVRDSLFTTYEKFMRAVTDGRWKLIRYPHINYTQLFDLKNDPNELHNLAADPAQRKNVARLTELLKDWQRRTDDAQPLSSPNPMPKEIDLTGHKRTPDRHQPEWIVRKYFEESPQ